MRCREEPLLMIFGTRSRSKRSVALALAVSLLLPSTALLLLPVCASAQDGGPVDRR